ncbi:Dyp-type peroxidase [Streptomyces sp. NPDC006530]|uniref:Dyp-type peroxidase n=1 Tax=Streptomyces sp. NPDC006530 TaxID=3364750 RepID=UPI0036906354
MTRRNLLLGAVAAAGGAGAVTAGVATHENQTPAAEKLLLPLRDPLPAPYTHMMAVDRADKSHPSVVDAVRQLHRVVTRANTGTVQAWWALGGTAFPDNAPRPLGLHTMPAFPGDVLEPEGSHGDALVQVTGDSAEAVRNSVETVIKQATAWRTRWRIDGFRPENRLGNHKGLTWNPFRFTEGFGNPADHPDVVARAIVRPAPGQPPWAVGGSYQVVRVVRLATDLWEKDSVTEQERIIGRRQDGRWLDGTPAEKEPDFASDPQGSVTPLDSHVRLAAPDRRSPPPLVRRSYSYNRSIEDRGLIFCCFQRDLKAGFEAAQKRLQGEAMEKYILTSGGGYFFVPPPSEEWMAAAFGG